MKTLKKVTGENGVIDLAHGSSNPAHTGLEMIDHAAIQTFQKTVWDYYRHYGRELPWRQIGADKSIDPYKILVSEMMLQQTQVSRVIPKYRSFLSQFPDIQALARASLAAVLSAWSGLGYNRRAKYLHDAAKMLAFKTGDWEIEELIACKGIGTNTAAAIIAYAYNKPVVFIETNIRSVYIYHFFVNQQDIHDKQLAPFIRASLDYDKPREFYWALMDYGVFLKASAGNAARQSKHYVKQTRFEGSTRQVRGQILKLLAHEPQAFSELHRSICDERLPQTLGQLQKEGLISYQNLLYSLAV